MENNLLINNTELLTPKEVAQFLKVSISQLAVLRCENYNKDKDGNLKPNFIPFVRFGNGKRSSIRYKKADVLAWIDRQTILK